MKTDTKTADLGTKTLQRLLHERASWMTGHSRWDSEDLVQDTLERALRNLHRFEQGSNLQAWLTTIMQRLLIDQRRRERGLSYQPLPDLPAPEIDSEREDRENVLLATVARIEELIASLPADFRLVLELYARAGLGYGEIARRLSIPVSTVGTRLLRARRLMRTINGQRAGTTNQGWAE